MRSSPIQLRSASLLIMAVLMRLAALRFASDVFVPVVLGVMLSYALTPWVNLLVRLHVPRVLAAAVLLLAIIGGTGGVIYSFSDDTVALIETLPKVAQQLQRGLAVQDSKGPSGAIDKVQKVASELERTAGGGNVGLEPERGVSKVQIQQPKFNVNTWLLAPPPR